MIFSYNQIQKFRKDTPGVNHRNHLNNAGASLMPKPVIQAIVDHIVLESRVGGYEASDYEEEAIAGFYQSAALLLNSNPSNIAFTANATDSFSRAISAIPFKSGDVILTTNEDYISNQITYLSFAKRFGTKLVRCASLEEGGVDLADLETKIVKYRPKLISITHIPTNSGLVQPVKEIGVLCKKYKVIYLIDACQSIGQTKLDVKELNCDFLSVTSRKFLRGPRGAGFLYVSDKILQAGMEPLFIDMRGADWVSDNIYIPREGAVRFEDWEFAYALVLGTKAAIDYLLKIDIDLIEKQVRYLSDYMRTELLSIDGVTVHDKGRVQGGLVTFHLNGSDPVFLKKELLKREINVSPSYRNYSVIDYDEKNVDWTIRVSPHYYNTIGEIDQFIEALKEIKNTAN